MSLRVVKTMIIHIALRGKHFKPPLSISMIMVREITVRWYGPKCHKKSAGFIRQNPLDKREVFCSTNKAISVDTLVYQKNINITSRVMILIYRNIRIVYQTNAHPQQYHVETHSNKIFAQLDLSWEFGDRILWISRFEITQVPTKKKIFP
jgi:hypothetical protein